METKKLNLTPIQELMHDLTYANGYHIEDISTMFRKVAIELALHAFNQRKYEDCVNMDIENHIYELDRFADAFDEVNKKYIESNK